MVGVLTEQKTQRGASNYWAKLKERLKKEGADQLLTNCQQLKMLSADGKRYNTDVANTEQLLRIIQSVPSKKAEPFKLWLAQVGRERIEETIDPEQAIDRALETYLKKGYAPDWVHQRLLSIRVRNELTDEWKDRGVRPGILPFVSPFISPLFGGIFRSLGSPCRSRASTFLPLGIAAEGCTFFRVHLGDVNSSGHHSVHTVVWLS